MHCSNTNKSTFSCVLHDSFGLRLKLFGGSTDYIVCVSSRTRSIDPGVCIARVGFGICNYQDIVDIFFHSHLGDHAYLIVSCLCCKYVFLFPNVLIWDFVMCLLRLGLWSSCHTPYQMHCHIATFSYINYY